MRYEHLEVVGRRQLPPTRLLRSGAMTVDPFLLRGAAVGAAWRAERGGAAGAVYHAVGGGPLPIASGLPVVVDAARPRAVGAAGGLPAVGRRAGSASACGRSSCATRRRSSSAARRRPAPRAGSCASGATGSTSSGSRRGRGSGSRPADRVGGGRGGGAARAARARRSLPRLHRAGSTPASTSPRCSRRWRAGRRRAAGRARRDDAAWPPRVLLVGASPDDRASIARAAAREGDRRVPRLRARRSRSRTWPSSSAARARAILPVVSEAAGLPVIEAIACGTPVVASAVGPLPELVGPAGLLVEPRDPDRLAVALATIWADDGVHDGIAALARERAESGHADLGRRRPRDPGDLRRGRVDAADRLRRRPTSASVADGARGRRVAGGVSEPVLERDRVAGRARRDDLDERLADGQRDLVARPCRRTWSAWSSTVFFQVPLIVRPLVEIQAVPLPTTSASRRGAPAWPSLSGPKRIRMTTTFFGRDPRARRRRRSASSRRSPSAGRCWSCGRTCT